MSGSSILRAVAAWNKHVHDLVRRQSNRFEVSVLCCGDDRQTVTERRDGASFTRVPSIGALASMPVCPGLIWRIRDYQPDLVHLHTPNPLGALAVATTSFKCPLIVEHHSDTIGRRALRVLADPFVRAAMNRAEAVIATSKRYLDSSPNGAVTQARLPSCRAVSICRL